MRNLDEQEQLIVRELIRNPRESDNRIGEITGVNVRTVGRKRQRLEAEGMLSYFTHLDLSSTGAGQLTTRHVYIIKFRLGIAFEQIRQNIRNEPKVRSVFTELLFESHIAEVDGHLALLLFVEGETETSLVQAVQEKLIPSLLANHGEGAIEEVSTLRLLCPVRTLRNYLPFVNMKDGYIRDDWPDDAIYVGKRNGSG